MSKLSKMVRVPRRAKIFGQEHRLAFITADEARLLKMVTDGRSDRTKWGVEHFGMLDAEGGGNRTATGGSSTTGHDAPGATKSGNYSSGAGLGGSGGSYSDSRSPSGGISASPGSGAHSSGGGGYNANSPGGISGGNSGSGRDGYIGGSGSGSGGYSGRVGKTAGGDTKYSSGYTARAYGSESSTRPSLGDDRGAPTGGHKPSAVAPKGPTQYGPGTRYGAKASYLETFAKPDALKPGKSFNLDPRFADALVSELQDAIQSGIKRGIPKSTLYKNFINEATRNRAIQQGYYDRHLRDPSYAAAPPGASSHQYGVGIDVDRSTYLGGALRQAAVKGKGNLTTAKPGNPNFDKPHVSLQGAYGNLSKFAELGEKAPGSVVAPGVSSLGRPVQTASLTPVPTMAPRPAPVTPAQTGLSLLEDAPRPAPPVPRLSPMVTSKVIGTPPVPTRKPALQGETPPVPQVKPGAAEFYGDEIDRAMQEQAATGVPIGPGPRGLRPAAGPVANPDPPDTREISSEDRLNDANALLGRLAASIEQDYNGPKDQSRLSPGEQQVNRRAQTNNANTSPPPSANAAVDPGLQYADDPQLSGVAIGPGPRGLRPATQPVSTAKQNKIAERIDPEAQYADLTGTQGVPQNIDEAPQFQGLYQGFDPLDSLELNKTARTVPSERDLAGPMPPQVSPEPLDATPQYSPSLEAQRAMRLQRELNIRDENKRGIPAMENETVPGSRVVETTQDLEPTTLDRQLGPLISKARQKFDTAFAKGQRMVNDRRLDQMARPFAARNRQETVDRGTAREERRIERRIARALMRNNRLKEKEANKLAKMVLEWNITYSPMSA